MQNKWVFRVKGMSTKLNKQMSTKFGMKDLGDAKLMLGMIITTYSKEGTLKLLLEEKHQGGIGEIQSL